MRKILLVIFSSMMLTSYAQHDHAHCSTHMSEQEHALATQHQIDFVKHKTQKSTLKTSNTDEMLYYPIQIHIGRQTDGTGGLTTVELDLILESLNDIYYEARIAFYQCASVNYIDSDLYYRFDETYETTLTNIHEVDNVINIYFFEELFEVDASNDTSYSCGYAYYPTSSRKRAFMDNGCAKNGSTLSHEIGHFFYLYHTHESSRFGAELVNGTDCATTGDLLCDTQADPQIGSSNVDDNGCTYDGTETDGNGTSYMPDVTNIMSYSPRACRYSFSEEQYERIRWAAETYRTDFSCSPTVGITANFNVDINKSSEELLTVEFTDVSIGTPTSWSWDFGDGNSSTSANPTHTYTTPGTYTVSLTASKTGSSDNVTQSKSIVVGAASIPFSEDFEDGTTVIDDIQFYSTLRNYYRVEADGANTGNYGLILEGQATSFSPYFQTPTSNDVSFDEGWNYYYKSSATFCVDATGYSDATLSFDIKQLRSSNDKYTNFRVLINGSLVEEVYHPTGSSTTWNTETIDLTDYVGDIIKITLEGSHKYDRTFGNGNATYLDNISVTGTAIPSSAAFKVSSETVCKGTTVTFTDQSSGNINSYSWDFGEDASVSSVTTDGPHEVSWSSAGSKTITLTTFGSGGNDTETKTNYITVNDKPTGTGTISGETTLCENVNETYSVTGYSNVDNYSWSTPTGWSNTPNSSSINITTSSTSGNISVEPSNECGSGTSSSKAVQVNPLPSAASSISGESVICESGTGTYITTTISNADSYSWTLPTGWSGSSTTNSINITAGATDGSLTVLGKNNCGEGSSSNKAIVVDDCITGIEEGNQPIRLQPNPAVNEVAIIGLSNSEEFRIYNTLGQQLLQGKVSPLSSKIDISILKEGLYLIQVDQVVYRLVKKNSKVN